MPRYIFRGDTPRNVADIGIDVNPGEEFESPLELDGPLFDWVAGVSQKAKASSSAVREVVPDSPAGTASPAEVAAEPEPQPDPEPAVNPVEEVAQ